MEGAMSYAVMLSDRPNTSGVLMMLDECRDAEEIAIEVRRAGHRVEVREVSERLATRMVLSSKPHEYS
jgi:hypothetical protein